MFNIFRTKVSVEEGRVLSIAADALVIPANDHLWMGSGLAGLIKREGGEEIEIEAVRQGPADLGRAIPTSAGALPFKRLYHAVVTTQDMKTHTEKIRPALAAALAASAGDGISKLLVAPLADEEVTGAFHEATREIVGGLLDELSQRTHLQEIILGVSGPAGHEAYRQALLKGVRG